MAITLGNVTSVNHAQTGGTTITTSHNNNGDYLVVEYSMGYVGASEVPTSVTFNGVAMTLLGNISNTAVDRWEYQYGLKNPASGVHDVVGTWPTFDPNAWVTVRSFSGVHQTTSVRATATQNGSSTMPSVTVTSAVNDWIVGGFVQNVNELVTPGTGVTEDSEGGDGTNYRGWTGHKDGAATSTTLDGTTGSAVNWGMVASSLQPADAAAPNFPFVMFGD